MTVIDERPADQPLHGITGQPFAITVNLATITGAVFSDFTGWAVRVFNASGAEQTASAPTTTSPSSPLVSVVWSGAQTLAMGAGAYNYELRASVLGAGPYGVIAGTFKLSKPGTPGASSSAAVTVTANVGTATVTASVTIGGTGGVGGGSGANLTYTASPTNGVVVSDTGTDATLPAATGVNAGLLLPADFTQLAGLVAALAAKQALDTDLTAIAALASAADKVPYATGAGTWALADLTAFARTILDDANAAAVIATLGLAALYQPLDADLTAIAGLTSAADKLPYFTGSGTAAVADLTTFGRSLIDDAAASNARTTLGLGTMAVEVAADYLKLLAGGSAVENLGAVESNVNTVAATGSTETLDTSVYGVHDCTMDQSCTFTFSNPAPSGKLSSFVLVLRGAFTPTFPAAVKWSSGAAPTYTTPSIYTFTTVDAGTTWYGAQVGKAFA